MTSATGGLSLCQSVRHRQLSLDILTNLASAAAVGNGDNIFDIWPTQLSEAERLCSTSSSSSSDGDRKIAVDENSTILLVRNRTQPFIGGRSFLMENIEFAVGITEAVVALLGSPANLLVLYLAFCVLRKNRAHKYSQWLVLNMTVFDLIFCLIHAPLMFDQLVLKNRFTVGLCTFMHFCTHASATGSSLSLLLLNLDKFIHLYKPLHYPSLVTKSRTIVACLIVSLLSLVWSSFLMFGPYMTNDISMTGQCRNRLEATGPYVFLAIMFFILPTLASLAISVFTAFVVIRSRSSSLLLAVRRQKKACGEETHQRGVVVLVPAKRNFGVPNQHHQPPAKEKDKDKYPSIITAVTPSKSPSGRTESFFSHFKIIGFVFTTTVWTSLTSLPYRIGYLWLVSQENKNVSPQTHFRMFVMFALLTLNAAGNPILTIVTQYQYTEAIRRLARRLRGSLLQHYYTSRSEHSSPTASKLGGGGGVGSNTKLTTPTRQPLITTQTTTVMPPPGETNPFLLQPPEPNGNVKGYVVVPLTQVQRVGSKKLIRVA